MFKQGDLLVVKLKFKYLDHFSMPNMFNEEIEVQEHNGNICVILKETKNSFIIYSFKNGCCYKWDWGKNEWKEKEVKRMKQYLDLYIPPDNK